MVKYTCPTCNKEFKQKQHYIEHTQLKKKPCKPNHQEPPKSTNDTPILHQNPPESAVTFENELDKQTDKIEEDKTNCCMYCNIVFTRKDTLKRHINLRCKVKKQLDEEKDKQNGQIEELKKLIFEQAKKIEELEKKKTTNNITINNTSNTTTNTDNSTKTINLMAHGSEDFSKIETKTILKHLCSENFESIVPNVAKEIFRNKNRPEFLNFEVTDLARNKSRYYDGDNWVVGNAEDGIEKVFENVNSTILEPFEKENIRKTVNMIIKDDKLKEKYKWIDWGRNFCGKLFTDDKEYVEHKDKICENIKHMMYNTKCSQVK